MSADNCFHVYFPAIMGMDLIKTNKSYLLFGWIHCIKIIISSIIPSLTTPKTFQFGCIGSINNMSPSLLNPKNWFFFTFQDSNLILNQILINNKKQINYIIYYDYVRGIMDDYYHISHKSLIFFIS